LFWWSGSEHPSVDGATAWIEGAQAATIVLDRTRSVTPSRSRPCLWSAELVRQ